MAIGDSIFSRYNTAAGFVVITPLRYMTQIAAGLSYAFNNLGKPIILTSGLRNMFSWNNDSIPNLSGSLLLSGNYNIPEVCVFANGQLFRGNRTIRLSCDSTEGFGSPNYPPLAILDTEITINWDFIQTPPIPQFNILSLNRDFNPNIAHLVVTPEINEVALEKVFDTPKGHFKYKGVIMESFGNGNLRLKSSLVKKIPEVREKGCFTFNITQCHQGSVLSFEMNTAAKLGAINCGDLVPAAAYAKVSQILSHNVPLALSRTLLWKN